MSLLLLMHTMVRLRDFVRQSKSSSEASSAAAQDCTAAVGNPAFWRLGLSASTRTGPPSAAMASMTPCSADCYEVHQNTLKVSTWTPCGQLLAARLVGAIRLCLPAHESIVHLAVMGSQDAQAAFSSPDEAVPHTERRLTWPAWPILDKGLLLGGTKDAPQEVAFSLWVLRGDDPGGLMPVAQVDWPPGSSTAFSFPAVPAALSSRSRSARLVSWYRTVSCFQVLNKIVNADLQRRTREHTRCSDERSCRCDVWGLLHPGPPGGSHEPRGCADRGPGSRRASWR